MKFRRALSCYERVRYLAEPTCETLANMGLAYFGLDELDRAKESFERAMEMKPDSLAVLYNLGIVYEKLGFVQSAKELFQKASRLDPRTAEEEAWVERAKEKVQ